MADILWRAPAAGSLFINNACFFSPIEILAGQMRETVNEIDTVKYANIVYLWRHTDRCMDSPMYSIHRKSFSHRLSYRTAPFDSIRLVLSNRQSREFSVRIGSSIFGWSSDWNELQKKNRPFTTEFDIIFINSPQMFIFKNDVNQIRHEIHYLNTLNKFEIGMQRT